MGGIGRTSLQKPVEGLVTMFKLVVGFLCPNQSSMEGSDFTALNVLAAAG